MTAFADRPIRWRIVAGVAALLAASTFFLAAYPSVRASWHGVSQFQDDTFYYLVTAKNFLHRPLHASGMAMGFCPLLLFWISRLWLLAHRGEMHDDPIIFAAFASGDARSSIDRKLRSAGRG